MKPLKPLYTHANYQLRLVYKDANKEPIDITGSSAKMIVRKSMYGEPVIDAAAVIDGPTGTISFDIPSTDTANILPEESDKGKYLIGAVLTLADGTDITLFQTTIDILKNIVRD